MPGYLTHSYFALKFSDDPSYVLGSIAPDFTLLLFDDPNHLVIQGLIGYLTLLKKKNKNFVNGLRNHVLFDKYMHENYIRPEAKKLSKKVGIHEDLAHGLMELAMDMEVYKKDKKLYEKMSNSLNYIREGEVLEYLSKYLTINRKAAREALKDGCEIVRLKDPFSLKSLIKKRSILKRHYHMRVLSGISIFKLRGSLKEAKKVIKGYEKIIEKAYKYVKKELKNVK